jgi:hypothetical protein
VHELAPLIAALVPVLIERPVMTGDDIEAAIAALTGGPAERTAANA